MKANYSSRSPMALIPMFTVCVLFGALSPVEASPKQAPSEWKEWAQWADQLHPVGDDDGHGPDIGSDEWAQALAIQLKVSDKQGHGPDLKSDDWKSAIERNLTKNQDPAKSRNPAKEKRERLSTHDTEARFLGIKDHRCMGMTALCPDRCGESGKLARFEITSYLSYKKPGEYGDPKQQEFSVLIEDNLSNPKVSPDILKKIGDLEVGSKVRLSWNHDYVTKDGTSSPERPITNITLLTNE